MLMFMIMMMVNTECYVINKSDKIILEHANDI